MAEDFKYNRFEGMSPMKKAMLILSEGAMAFGEGMSGKPFYSTYMERDAQNAKMAYEQFQQKRQQEAYQNMMAQGGVNAQGGTIPTVKIPDPNSKVGFRVEVDPAYKAEMEITKQADIAKLKENEVALGKSERLNTVMKTIENQWLKTSPYKGAITKTGLVPILGAWDVMKKGLGATEAQQNDQAYANFISGIRAQLARGMGDVGNLSEYEQRAVVQLAPTLMDSYESGQKKIGQMAQFIEDIRTTRQKSGKFQYTIDGKTYDIPKDKVEAFKKAKGIK